MHTLQHAASVEGLDITAEVMIAELPKGTTLPAAVIGDRE
jgi:hypothetical protein